MSLTAVPDSEVKVRAKRGDTKAQAEMVRRGLAGDPVMERERSKKKREFDLKKDWR